MNETNNGVMPYDLAVGDEVNNYTKSARENYIFDTKEVLYESIIGIANTLSDLECGNFDAAWNDIFKVRGNINTCLEKLARRSELENLVLSLIGPVSGPEPESTNKVWARKENK